MGQLASEGSRVDRRRRTSQGMALERILSDLSLRNVLATSDIDRSVRGGGGAFVRGRPERGWVECG